MGICGNKDDLVEENNTIPGGSYKVTGRRIEVNNGILKCELEDAEGYWIEASIKIVKG